MQREYSSYLQEFFKKKAILITGARQCGKTTITRLFSGTLDYLNFDSEGDRDIITKKEWNRNTDIVVFDELHKMKNWKRWLKGVIDTEGYSPAIVVTGSARLDTYRKVGDSLAGRYFQYRIHPLDVREICLMDKRSNPKKVLEKLMITGGFPEPYLEGSLRFYNLWKKSHLDIVIRQDLITLESVRDIRSIEILIDLLKKRVGSPISYSSLATDLQVSDKTVKHWLSILENMYIIFKITPYHKNVARSILKQPKYYFYDNARVTAGEGAILENAVACSLLKECHFRQDCLGEEFNLWYLAKRDGLEIDFLLTKNEIPNTMIEVKLSDDSVSKSFRTFSSELPEIKKVQLVKNLKRKKTSVKGVEVVDAAEWLVSW